jgi:hypothetical protein
VGTPTQPSRVTPGFGRPLVRLPRVKVKYRFSLDDPAQARERRFVRDEDDWPFPSLPAPGDAVVIEAPGLPPLEGRPVDRVMYRAATGEALIDLSADGLSNDVEEQVAVLREMGFREI